MKKLITLSLSLAIILGSFSCKNSVDIVKRHYNTGFYVNHIKKTHSVKDEIAKNTESRKSIKHNELNSIPVKTVIGKKTNVEFTASITSGSQQIQKRISLFHKNVDEAINLSKKKHHKFNFSHKKNLLKKASKGGSSDANLVLMIILCLFPFICLIPVYLHDGKSITLNFWITLLLHLTFIGYAIFSILVVLDIVDLA